DPAFAARGPQIASRPLDHRPGVANRALEVASCDTQHAGGNTRHGLGVGGCTRSVAQGQSLAVARTGPVAAPVRRVLHFDEAAIGELAQMIVEAIRRAPEL